MPNQTVTRATESEVEPVEIYNILADTSSLPQWAPVFADTIEPIDEGHFNVTKNGTRFQMELFLHPSAGAVDYLREMAGNRRGGAYIRVVPRPLGGSTVTMTVPLAPGATESDAAQTLEQELNTLVHLARR